MIQITSKPVQPWKDFILMPWRAGIYKNDPNWVPQLISEDKKLLSPEIHPFHKHAQVQLFIASENNRPLGRIAAVVNQAHNEFHQEKCGFFGFFECVNSKEAAHQLLDEARKYLKAKGMELMRGPASFSTNETCGLLVEGIDSPPVIMMPYNPPYYIELLTSYGLAKAKDLLAYELATSAMITERLERIARRIQANTQITVRKADMKNIFKEAKLIKEVYNHAWSKNWGFVPMTDAEFDYMARDMKQIVDADFLLIAEADGRPIGFSLALPDLNFALRHVNGRLFPLGIFKLLWYARRIKTLRVLTMGIIHEYQKRGIDVIFYLETLKNGIKKGFTGGELSWILEDNEMMNRSLEAIGAKVYKRYRFYEMNI